MKQKKKYDSDKYGKTFLLGCVLSVFTSLVISTAWTTYLFAKREAKRTEVFQQQLKTAIERQYKLLSEETWTKNFESIHIRLEEIASSLGTNAHLILIEDANGSCLHFESEENTSCADAHKALSTSPYPSISEATASIGELPGKLIYRVKLEIAAVELGGLIFVIADPNNFLLSEGVFHFAVESMIVPGILITCLWMGWFLYALRHIMRPYVSGLMTLQQKAAYAATARQVGHDIQSPLLVMERIVQKATFPTTKEQELISNALTRLKGIVSDLATRSATGLLKTNAVPQNTAATAGEQIQSISNAITQVVAEKQIEANGLFTFNIHWGINPKDATPVRGDEHQVKRALSNLINNAMNASAPGQSIDIKVKQNHERTRIIVDITDYGSGMDQATLAKLGNEEFTSNAIKGTGIGFIWSKSVIEGIGGQIAVNSQQGVGTTVSLEFVGAPAAAVRDDRTQVQKIILLEDDAFIPEIIREEIKRENLTASLVHLETISALESELETLPNGGECLFILDYHIFDQTTGAISKKIKQTHPSSLVVLYSESEAEVSERSAYDRVFAKSDLPDLIKFLKASTQ